MRLYSALVVVLILPAVALAQEKADKPILVLNTGGHTDSITRLMFTPDGEQLVSVSKDRTIRLWDIVRGEGLGVLRPPIGPGRAGTLYAAALSPNGEILATGGIGLETDKPPIYLVRLGTGRIERLLMGHAGTIIGVAFSPDGKRLACVETTAPCAFGTPKVGSA